MGKSGGLITNDIRALRFHHGEMTQQALADLVGVTRQTVNAIEANKYSPSLEVAFRIARVFGVPLEQVFQVQGNRPAHRPSRHGLVSSGQQAGRRAEVDVHHEHPLPSVRLIAEHRAVGTGDG